MAFDEKGGLWRVKVTSLPVVGVRGFFLQGPQHFSRPGVGGRHTS